MIKPQARVPVLPRSRGSFVDSQIKSGRNAQVRAASTNGRRLGVPLPVLKKIVDKRRHQAIGFSGVLKLLVAGAKTGHQRIQELLERFGQEAQ
jgi:hypothetical protein